MSFSSGISSRNQSTVGKVGIQLKREIELCLEVCKTLMSLLIIEGMDVLESSQKEPENEFKKGT